MKILIHADSGTIMGSGHIMRCLVLADELNKTVLHFACRDLPGNITSVIESRGYKVKILNESLEQANKEFIDFIKQEKPEILILDNYDTDIMLESMAREHVGHIVVIDDLANRKHDCDILLDQNPCPNTHTRYKNLVPQFATKLLGLKYALLGSNYRLSSNLKNDRIINILIFFGGGDHKNLTEKVINSLIIDSNFHGYSFNVVVGKSNLNKEKIRTLCESQKNFAYHCQINNMAELMSKTDLFIGAGGTTNWERMCVGLPGIIISIADNQEESCHELAKLDVIKYLGTAEEFIPKKFLTTLQWIEENPQWLCNAAKLGKEMVDGNGAKRVAAYINTMSIILKQAHHDDCINIHKWRNSPENRVYSINNNEISLTDHEKWFAKIINNKDHNLLIAYHNNQPIGVVRFDYAGQTAEISLYLTPGQHSKGYGLPLLIAAENWLKNNHSDINEINAQILQENIASLKIFQYALYNAQKSDKNILLFNKRLNP